MHVILAVIGIFLFQQRSDARDTFGWQQESMGTIHNALPGAAARGAVDEPKCSYQCMALTQNELTEIGMMLWENKVKEDLDRRWAACRASINPAGCQAGVKYLAASTIKNSNYRDSQHQNIERAIQSGSGFGGNSDGYPEISAMHQRLYSNFYNSCFRRCQVVAKNNARVAAFWKGKAVAWAQWAQKSCRLPTKPPVDATEPEGPGISAEED